MHGQYISERHLRFDPDIPEADARMADDVADDYDRRRRDEIEAQSVKLDDIVNRAKYRFRTLVGAENWLALRRRMRDEQVALRDLLQPPQSRTADYAALDAQRRDAVQHMLDGFGMSTANVREIYREMVSAASEITRPRDEPSGQAQWQQTEEHAQIARDVLRSDSPWVTFRAPFAGFQRGFGPWGTARVGANQPIDTASGLVGNELNVNFPDASDVEIGGGIADSQVAFTFFAPAAGNVEVFIEARNGECLHQISTSDEFGWSDANGDQWNYLMAHVLHPNVSGPSFAWLSHFRWTTDGSLFAQRRFLVQGGIYTARLFSNGPVQRNQFVGIRVGTRSDDDAFSNDVTVRSHSNFRWTIQAVSVRIAP